MNEKPSIVLFRNDLRVRDNGALSEAAGCGKPIVAVFLLEDAKGGTRPSGAAFRWWLHHSLKAHAAILEGLGSHLILRAGDAASELAKLIDESGADAVFWNRRYDPAAAAIDSKMKDALRRQGLRAESFDGQLLHEPTRLLTGSGSFYKVFKPFWNALTSGPEPRDPIDPPRKLRGFERKLNSERLEDLLPLPTSPDWATGLHESWTPGENGAVAALEEFISSNLKSYAEARDFPAHHTSRLSPHLAHGEITPFSILAAIRKQSSRQTGSDAVKFRQEVAWREFSYHLLFHNPDMHRKNFNSGTKRRT